MKGVVSVADVVEHEFMRASVPLGQALMEIRVVDRAADGAGRGWVRRGHTGVVGSGW